jgi:enoyl-CoA hydratase
MEEVLQKATNGAVRILTMNRPGHRNALSIDLIHRLADELRAADEDPLVKVVILTGTDPAFCSGFYLQQLSVKLIDPLIVLDPVESPWQLLSSIGVPVIGAVNGPAVTNGLALALRCSFLVASDRATFGDTNLRIGMHPGAGESALLARAIGPRLALEMSLRAESEFLTAQMALQRGLVNHVVPHKQLMPFAQEVAASVAFAHRDALRMANELFRKHAASVLQESMALEADGYRQWPFDPKAVEERHRAAMAHEAVRRGKWR